MALRFEVFNQRRIVAGVDLWRDGVGDRVQRRDVRSVAVEFGEESIRPTDERGTGRGARQMLAHQQDEPAVRRARYG
jgi:hypothetical protein